MPYMVPNPYVQPPPHLLERLHALEIQKLKADTKFQEKRAETVDRELESRVSILESRARVAGAEAGIAPALQREQLAQESHKTSKSSYDRLLRGFKTANEVAKQTAKLAVFALVTGGAYKGGQLAYDMHKNPYNTMYNVGAGARETYMGMAKGATAGFFGLPRDWIDPQVAPYKLPYYPTQDVPPGEGTMPIGPWPKPKNVFTKTHGSTIQWNFDDGPVVK